MTYVSSLKKVSLQTLWQLIGKAVTSFSTLIILGAVSRHYGTSGTGVFTLALTYLAFFYLAADFGWNAYVMPDLLNEDPNLHWRKLLGARILWALTLIILSLLLLEILPFHNPEFNLAVLFGCLAILGNAIFVTSNAFFQSRLKYNYSILASSIDAIPTVLLVLALIGISAPLPSLLAVHMFTWLFTGVVSLFFVKKFIRDVTPLFDFNYLRGLVKGALPISLTLVLNVVYFRVDSFILTTVRSFNEVGIYNLAYQVFQSALVLPTFIMNGYYPLMLEALKGSKEVFVKELKKVLLIMIGISVIGVLTTLVLAPLVIHIVSGGKEFASSANSLRILALSFPAYFVSSVLMWVLVSLKEYKPMLIIYMVGLFTNLTLNLIFIPQFSYIAASYITGISEYLILVLQIIMVTKRLKIWS